MELTTLYRLIGLQPEIVERLKPFHNGSDRMRLGPYLERLTMPETAQEAYLSLKEVLGEDPDGLAMLYCQLEAARQVYRRYQEKGIPERIFVDTMRCFPRFIAECEKKDGRLLFDRGWWSYRQTSMCLFRIGALEYEFRKHEGEPAVALHIPSGADLSEPAVNDSLEQAGRFFQTHYRDYKYSRYICISWLLSRRWSRCCPRLPVSVLFSSGSGSSGNIPRIWNSSSCCFRFRELRSMTACRKLPAFSAV